MDMTSGGRGRRTHPLGGVTATAARPRYESCVHNRREREVAPPVHYVTLRHVTLHYCREREAALPLRYVTLRYVTLRYDNRRRERETAPHLHYIMLRYATLHYIVLQHYITLHYITAVNTRPLLLYITLHCITLHYITLHYITAVNARPRARMSRAVSSMCVESSECTWGEVREVREGGDAPPPP